MKTHHLPQFVAIAAAPLLTATSNLAAAPPAAKTKVSIEGDRFLINGHPTYAGHTPRVQ